MKKVISITVLSLLLTFSSPKLNASESVWVSAIVGNPPIMPLVLSTQPDINSIVVIQRNKIQEFSLYVQDLDSDVLDFTVTSEIGSVSPLSGTVNNAISGTYINFTFLAPTTKPSPNDKKIIVTISDRDTPIVVKQFQLYIY